MLELEETLIRWCRDHRGARPVMLSGLTRSDTVKADHALAIGCEVIVVSAVADTRAGSYILDTTGQLLRDDEPTTPYVSTIDDWLDVASDSVALTEIAVLLHPRSTVFRSMEWYGQSFKLLEPARLRECLDEKFEKYIDAYDKQHTDEELLESLLPYCEGAARRF